MACPVSSLMTGDPELPPVVSTWYWIVESKKAAYGPVWVCWIWFQLDGELSVPWPVTRIVCPSTGGGVAARSNASPCAWNAVRPVSVLAKHPK